MHSLFIALFRIDAVFGHFGRGLTKEDAIRALKNAGGRWSKKAVKEDRCVLYEFSSDLPFVPIVQKRQARKGEADAYVTGDGSLRWVRCTRSLVEAAEKSAAPLPSRYRVIWEFDSDASTPFEAAREAEAAMKDPSQSRTSSRS